MKRIVWSMLVATLALTGCEDGPPQNAARDMVASDAAPQNQFGFMEAMEPGYAIDPFGEGGPSAEQIASSANYRMQEGVAKSTDSAPQVQIAQELIAYSYDYGFAIVQENIPKLQSAHLALCESMGPGCRMLRLSQAGTDGYDGYGELRLQVDAKRAKAFGTSLSKPAEELGGEQVSFVVDGEDLSETIIDTEARLKSRLVLRDKLTAILRSNRGSVDELVKAEKAVADVNEEIDANRSRLEEMRNRIRFSAISIEYNPYLGQNSTGFVRPVTVAFTSIGSTLGKTISILIYLATALIPITIFLLGLRWLWRKSSLRIRRPRAEIAAKD